MMSLELECDLGGSYACVRYLYQAGGQSRHSCARICPAELRVQGASHYFREARCQLLCVLCLELSMGNLRDDEISLPRIHTQPLRLSVFMCRHPVRPGRWNYSVPASNDAINTTLNKFGLDLKGLLQNQHLCTEIVQYHILPSPIEVRSCSNSPASSCCFVP